MPSSHSPGQNRLIPAFIDALSDAVVEAQIHNQWWHDAALKKPLHPMPIDRTWHWIHPEIEINGHIVPSMTVGLFTEDGYLQGAMLISSAAVTAGFRGNKGALFVEWLFTAPRNRSILRKDGKKYFGGVGLELLRWGTLFSHERGCGGALQLHASPDYLGWYARIGFENLLIEPVTYQGVQYTPMELPMAASQRISDRDV